MLYLSTTRIDYEQSPLPEPSIETPLEVTIKSPEDVYFQAVDVTAEEDHSCIYDPIDIPGGGDETIPGENPIEVIITIPDISICNYSIPGAITQTITQSDGLDDYAGTIPEPTFGSLIGDENTTLPIGYPDSNTVLPTPGDYYIIPGVEEGEHEYNGKTYNVVYSVGKLTINECREIVNVTANDCTICVQTATRDVSENTVSPGCIINPNVGTVHYSFEPNFDGLPAVGDTYTIIPEWTPPEIDSNHYIEGNMSNGTLTVVYCDESYKLSVGCELCNVVLDANSVHKYYVIGDSTEYVYNGVAGGLSNTTGNLGKIVVAIKIGENVQENETYDSGYGRSFDVSCKLSYNGVEIEDTKALGVQDGRTIYAEFDVNVYIGENNFWTLVRNAAKNNESFSKNIEAEILINETDDYVHYSQEHIKFRQRIHKTITVTLCPLTHENNNKCNHVWINTDSINGFWDGTAALGAETT